MVEQTFVGESSFEKNTESWRFSSNFCNLFSRERYIWSIFYANLHLKINQMMSTIFFQMGPTIGGVPNDDGDQKGRDNKKHRRRTANQEGRRPHEQDECQEDDSSGDAGART